MTRHPVLWLHLVRHPKPAVEPGTCYGSLDVDVDEPDAAALVERLVGALPRDAMLASSPLRRCAGVARALHAAGWAAPLFDARLAEMHFGCWEGRRWDELPREQVDAWAADVAGYRPPGGESVADLARRATAAVGELVARCAPVRALVVITHAGVLQTVPRLLTGRPLDGFSDTRVEYGAVLTLRCEAGAWRPGP